MWDAAARARSALRPIRFLRDAVAALLYDYLYLRPLAPIPVEPPETGVEEPRPGQAASDLGRGLLTASIR
jgi:hypothetical protein